MALSDFYRTTVGKKVVMALSGAILVGFVFAHMAGNLKFFSGINPATGSYKFDEYGCFLRQFGSEIFGYSGFLWLARIVLLLALVAHAISGISLARLNRLAKPVVSQGARYSSANAASRSMIYGGLFLLLFIIYHILHLTTGTLHFRGFVEGSVYANVYNGFLSFPVAFFYIFSMICLALHLYHGAWSMFQTVGLTSSLWDSRLKLYARIFAYVIFLGFCSLPIGVWVGAVAKPNADVKVVICQ
ncbi:MAG TPA: succinate dehydrogenase cytochrome b subunit [Oligoflexia bacterium]|nr:succinate dehydrogenase cytochrome b subunit [Oligoflexia bacterium]HMP26688.1 succinate dehydrogenase cytochrome b subunit [Oligoflexia bacterium]